MNVLFLILAVGAGFSFLATAIQGLVAWHSANPQLQRRLRPFIIGCVILTIAFVGASYYSLPSTQSATATLPTSTSTVASSSPAQSPTTTSGSQLSPTATSTSQVTSDVTPTALAPDGTITENKLLTCSSCSSDPIHFTIDSITIDNANGRTVWNVTLKNVSGSYYYVYNYQSQGITLQESAGTNQPVQATGYSVPQMAPGDKDTTQLIFAFVPHKGVQYTFSAHILTNTGIDMPFDPVNFTF